MSASPRPARIGMRIIRSPEGMSRWSAHLIREGVRIALVPTMGALHAGHLALIKRARLACDAVVVSLYVNPRQFGPRDDWARYPRRFRRDAALCRAQGVDVVFAPNDDAVYPPGFATVVSVPSLSRRWEGACRPGHFEGVATIVTKLLCLVRPSMVFFGQKDYQQSLVVRRLVADLNLGPRVSISPTVREPDGLAVSSRNEYLSAPERAAAPVLYRALQAGQRAVRAGARRASQVRQTMRHVVRREPRARVEYLAVADPRSLEPVTRLRGRVVLLGSIWIGRVRLLDNLVVTARTRR